MKNFILLTALAFTVFGNVFGQGVKMSNGGIVNGRATYLPLPDYPQEAKDLCASGQVLVKVLIDENGNVIEAEALSGDELLRDYAVEAAKKAKFRQISDSVPVKIGGTLVYNFIPERICVDAGVVNKKARNLPKPVLNPDLKINEETTVRVRVVIDEAGKVILAKAISLLTSSVIKI